MAVLVQPGVDFCPPAAAGGASLVGGEALASEFMCNACNEGFATAGEQRAHCKMERHNYNTKRRLAGLKPIGQEAWERKLREARGTDSSGPGKGTAHLKPGKREAKAEGSDAGKSASTAGYPAAATPQGSEAVPSESAATDAATDAAKEFEGPWTPGRCLFDRKTFDDIEQNLEYMRKTYDFYIPDCDYCTDVPGLLEFMWHKVVEEPYTCLFCNKKFVDAVSCRRHMLDKRHTRIGTEAKTRTGGTDEFGSQEMQADLEEFFDFTSSTLEVTEKIGGAERVGCILRYFDADRDRRLQHSELAVLWAAAADGAELSEAMYKGACGKAGADPEEGLDEKALGRLYSEGLADLDAHFRVLQNLLAKKLSSRAKARETIPEGEDEDGEEGAEKGEDDDDSVEVLECEDEDEFEEVMRVLGLQAVTMLDNGDLRLPNGMSAVHRDVAHIWKQRGTRPGALALMGMKHQGKKSILPMLGDSPGGTTMAISRRAQNREEKHYVAVLKREQKYRMKLGISQNDQQKRPTKIRTGLGDASGGR